MAPRHSQGEGGRRKGEWGRQGGTGGGTCYNVREFLLPLAHSLSLFLFIFLCLFPPFLHDRFSIRQATIFTHAIPILLVLSFSLFLPSLSLSLSFSFFLVHTCNNDTRYSIIVGNNFVRRKLKGFSSVSLLLPLLPPSPREKGERRRDASSRIFLDKRTTYHHSRKV